MRRRTAFELASMDNGGNIDEGSSYDDRVLDEQEQDAIVHDLFQLGRQSSRFWRIACNILEASCILIFVWLPIPVPPNHNLSYLFSRSFILAETIMACLITIMTILPELTLGGKRTSSTGFGTLNTTTQDVLRSIFTPSLATLRHCNFATSLLLPVLSSGIRAAIACFTDKLVLEGVFLFSAPFVVHVISLLTIRYANELENQVGQLRSLKYENKGV